MEVRFFKDDIPNGLNIGTDLAIDTETMGLNLHRDRLCVIQISDKYTVYLVQFSNETYNAPNLCELLSNKAKRVIFHYARFDLAAIRQYLGVYIDCDIFCTKIASKIARTYTEYHGLKELCRELLNVHLSKQQQSSYWYDDALSDEQKDYAARDVIYLHRLRDILITRLKKLGRYELALETFQWLNTRVTLDLLGYDIDIFAHS